jgi:alkylresorcinol/alkylpyrone synthase
MPYIAHVTTAFPDNYYEQDVMIESLKKVWSKKYFNLDRLEEFHKNVLVGGRSLALPLEKYFELEGFQSKNDHWIEVATTLGEKLLTKMFDETSLSAKDIQAFYSTTITGIAVPSLEARLMNKFPFSPDVKRTPMMGLGCLAGAAGINRVADYLKAYPDQAALFISVELCSLTIQFKDLSIPNIISTGLFGDGGAAVLMVGDDHPLAEKSPLKWLSGKSHFFPDTERVMGWDMVDEGFKIVLNKAVPQITSEHMPALVEQFLGESKLEQKDLSFYVAHPGGPKVLQAMEKALNLNNGELELSWKGLQEQGNMSSSSVLFVLKETLKKKNLNKGQRGLMLAMGPAFCAELSLVESMGVSK